MSLRCLIADDHTLVSEGLEVMLSMAEDVELAGTVSNGQAAIDAAREGNVDVILMDVNPEPGDERHRGNQASQGERPFDTRSDPLDVHRSRDRVRGHKSGGRRLPLEERLARIGHSGYS